MSRCASGISIPFCLNNCHSRMSTSDCTLPTPPSGSDIHTRISCSTALSPKAVRRTLGLGLRSEEHTSELQSLMRTSYVVFCLKKKNTQHETYTTTPYHLFT